MNNFEKNPRSQSIEKREELDEKTLEEMGLIRAKSFLRENNEKLAQEGIPVLSDGRLNLEAFKSVYPEKELAYDAQRVLNFEKGKFGSLKDGRLEEEKEKHLGEQLEILAAAVFTKFLSKDFLVLRSTKFDDLEAGVDTILVDGEGNIVCAFDEVGEIKGPKFEEKKERVIKADKKGVRLKYGLKLDTQQNKFVPAGANHIPIFYIALRPDLVKMGLKKFNQGGKDDNDLAIFVYFLHVISAQIKELDLISDELTPEIKKKISSFEQKIKPYFSLKSQNNK